MQIFQKIIFKTEPDSARDFVTPFIKIDNKIYTYMNNVFPHIEKGLL